MMSNVAWNMSAKHIIAADLICIECLTRSLDGPLLVFADHVRAGTSIRCSACLGSQREPLPFSEVWCK